MERINVVTRAIRIILLIVLGGAGPLADLNAADDVYMKPSAFLASAFEGTPRAGLLTLSDSMQEDVEGFLGRPYSPAMVRYWCQGDRSAWILNEIGKTKPITVGFVVNKGAIERVEVLIYRESHGWEVRQPFFTRQFRGANLEEDAGLTNRIDSISGATLSVRALTRLAKLALYLDKRRAAS